MTTEKNPIRIQVGDRVKSRKDLYLTNEDYDQGYVLAIDDRQITVGWDSGVMTTQDISLLDTLDT